MDDQEFNTKLHRILLFHYLKSTNQLKRIDPQKPKTKKRIDKIFPKKELAPEISKLPILSHEFEYLKLVLNVHDFNEILEEMMHEMTSDLYWKDLVIYRHFLMNYWISELGLLADYSKTWKLNEEEYIKSELTDCIYSTSNNMNNLLLLNVLNAEDLFPKDNPHGNNVFFTVEYLSVFWMGPLIKNTLSPVFNYKLPM
jgi:hypothetical protein